MRKILLASLVALGISGAYGAGYNCLKVGLADGSQVDIRMSDDLRVKFTESQLVAVGTDTDVAVDRDNILYFNHDYEDWDSVKEVSTDSAPRFNGDSMLFDSLPDGSVIAVFDMAGATVMSHTASGSHELRLGLLPAGVYVVRVNNMSYKVTVR